MKARLALAGFAVALAAISSGSSHAQQAPVVAAAGAATGDRPGFGAMIPGAQPARPDDAGILAQAVGDMDGDGRDELVVGLGHYPPQTNRSERIVVLSPDANGVLVERTTALVSKPPSFTHPRAIQMKDLNRDGRADVFIAGHGYDTDPFPGERNALLMSNAGGKHTKVTRGFPKFKDFTHGAALGDVNGDRRGDVFVGNGFGKSPKSRPYMLLGKRGNAVGVSRKLADDVLGPDTYYSSAALADVNGDGRDDLILGSNGNGNRDRLQRNVIYFNTGRKTIFRSDTPDVVLPRGRYGDGTNTVDIRTADINGDGFTDLIMAQHGNVPTFHGYGIQVLINRGNGQFRDETKTRFGGPIKDSDGQFLNHVMPADFFGDGHPDFVTFGGVGDGAPPVFYINDGAGFFSRHDESLFMPPEDTYLYHGMALPGDVNGDGLSDIINMSFGGGDFGTATYLNTGPVGAQTVPTIVRQPVKATVKRTDRKTVRLSVAASGGRPLSYAWTRDGKPVASDGPVLTIKRPKKRHAGIYRVTVSNDAGAVASRSVRLRVR
ncbi:FG-GAP-like repeat-containing protein [Microbaculum marinisediminis]|uniref:FG-GAP-like repeat-containing protein n=1 Tax=Microbaculum marinisediminis TaxID=2931392 RepID=A0AAW5R847_9HYPH|nr:FG-GAP-like repeat-containing protein [Microbaculum sp. A6E488]MCT8974824.1 FG-GAP-like repeat-containing protein [Microbaculum sp. A6E488]